MERDEFCEGIVVSISISQGRSSERAHCKTIFEVGKAGSSAKVSRGWERS
jgi:hypothetical protein